MRSGADSDPLGDLAARSQPSERDTALCRIVFARTTQVLRRRRATRRFGLALLCVGCYLAGAISVRLTSVAGIADERHVAHTTPQHSPNVTSSLPLEDSSQSSSSQAQPPEDTYQAFCDAGGHAWRETGDLPTAIRWYAKALEVASPKELAISVANDDWILMSLKEARSQERRNADYQDGS